MTNFIEGIVINNHDYDSYAQIITVFTKQKGKLSFYANGVRKQNSKNKYSVGLFNLSEFEIFLSPNKFKLSKLKTGTLLKNNINISTNYSSYLWASLIIDLINKNFESQQKSFSTFNFLKSFLIYAIEYINDDVKSLNVALFTIWKLFRVCGFDFESNECSRCLKKNSISTFSIQEKGFICNLCINKKDYHFPINILKVINLWNNVPSFEKIKNINLELNDLEILKKIIFIILDEELGYMGTAFYKLNN